MNDLFGWYNELDFTGQVFWGCAIVSSVIFVIQSALTLIGMDSTDTDVDFDGSDTMDLGGGISLFTVRNVVNFFLGFGWAGVSFRQCVPNTALLSLIAVAFGCLFVAAFFLVMKQLRKLESNGAFKIADCAGLTADVYLRIPGHREGRGKVQVSVNGSVHEIDAVADGEHLPTGSKVKITQVLGDILLVERA